MILMLHDLLWMPLTAALLMQLKNKNYHTLTFKSTSISGINSDLLDPRTSWASLEAYQENVQELIAQFQKNFEQFSQAEAYRKAGPQSR